jgi:hypothetical protein
MVALAHQRSGPERCPNGHLTVNVSRGCDVRPVCPLCLEAALNLIAGRACTVNDYLARYEAGPLQKMPKADAVNGAKLLKAAEDLFGSSEPSECRRVVREVARSNGVPVKEVMLWSLARMAKGLEVLKVAA